MIKSIDNIGLFAWQFLIDYLHYNKANRPYNNYPAPASLA